MIRAYAYLRVSSKGQLNGFGNDRQRETIQAYADAHGIEIAGWYSDAHTGTEEDRTGFMEMLAAILSNGVRTILVEQLDRLARDLMVQTTLLAKLEAEGITLISASTGEDVTSSMRDDPMRRALVQIQGVFAELDKNLLVRKLQKGREARREASGRCEGRKPYGHYDAEQAVVERFRALYRKPRRGNRLSISKIASQLNEEGLYNRKGSDWLPANLTKCMKSAGVL